MGGLAWEEARERAAEVQMKQSFCLSSQLRTISTGEGRQQLRCSPLTSGLLGSTTGVVIKDFMSVGSGSGAAAQW